jgi:hypothetical protein
MEGAKIDRYRQIVLGIIPGTAKQREMLVKYRHGFSLLCEGWTPMQVAHELMKEFDCGTTMGLRIVRDSIAIFGDAAKFSKKGMKAANYERLMKLAKKCEERGEYGTARLLIKDANELLGLVGDSEEHLENNAEWMRPDGFVIITDPAVLENANKIITVESEDAEIINDEETTSPDNLSDSQTG